MATKVTAPPTAHQLFVSDESGRFRIGHVFQTDGSLLAGGEQLAANGSGYWRCDIAENNRLTWGDRVYELFGLPAGDTLDRGQAVARYTNGSKTVLERLRSFSIRNRCGFILDAIMTADAGAEQIRVFSIPILSGGEVIALHGLKRAL